VESITTEQEQKAKTIRETYFDYAGNPTLGEEGFVTRVQMLNDKGRVISVAWLDVEGNPMNIAGETYCRVDYTYDKAGNINRERYYDAEGQPVRNAEGYAIIYREYDASNRVVYEKFYDVDGFAIAIDGGVVAYRYTYDAGGNLLTCTAYDYFDHEINP